VPGVDVAIAGQPAKFGFCFGELPGVGGGGRIWAPNVAAT
jgi:hypothetical protein